jgi:hypothetical protein
VDLPEWLPAMAIVNGDWGEVVAKLYGIFQRAFVSAPCQFMGYRVTWDRRVVEGRYEEGFWHLITREDYSRDERLPDFRRAERLPWCSPTISNCEDIAVRVWDYQEGNRRNSVRTYLWLYELDYVVVLEKQITGTDPKAILVTAFHVDGRSARRSLETKLGKASAATR